MKIPTLIMSIVSIALSCEARLLETREELVKRYGQPKSERPSELVFTNGELSIYVTLGLKDQWFEGESVEGRVVTERVGLAAGAFSDQAIQNILEANSGGKVWHPFRSSGGTKASERLARIRAATSGITTEDRKRMATIKPEVVEVKLQLDQPRKKDAVGY